jgi:hypothetical protein
MLQAWSPDGINECDCADWAAARISPARDPCSEHKSSAVPRAIFPLPKYARYNERIAA